MNTKSVLRFLYALIFGYSIAGSAQNGRISGTIFLDSTWARNLYVSRIPDFNQMYTASSKFIVAKGSLDSLGNFDFNFPTENSEGLYRMHIVKNDDPVSMLIIGGKEQNHAFFIAKKFDHIEINQQQNRRPISQQSIFGSHSNSEMKILFQLLANDNVERDSLKRSLLTQAENASSEIVKLFAIHNLFGISRQQKAQVEKLLANIDADNPYGVRLQQVYLISKRGLFPVMLLLLFLGSFILVYRVFIKRRNRKIKMSLSQRETTIAELILNNKTNKEIAGQLKIEISTVKTHINNIFEKLKISKRKELKKYSDIFKT